MENIRINPQGRACYVGNRRFEFFDVVADSERFGKNAIMCQGTFSDCLAYLGRCGISYFEECWKRNRGRDVQVSFRMYTVTGRSGDHLILKDREGFTYLMEVSDLTPCAPNTFKLSPGMRGEKVSTVKMMEARTW